MGQHKRTREVLTPMDHGGEECDTNLEETQSCKTQECPIHCKYGAWTAWSACDAACGPGSQTRTRAEDVPAQNGGLPCEGEASEVQDCEDAPCPVPQSGTSDIGGTWGMGEGQREVGMKKADTELVNIFKSSLAVGGSKS